MAQSSIMLEKHDVNDLARTVIRNGVEVLRCDRYDGPGLEQASFDCAEPEPGADRIKCLAVAMSTGKLSSGDTVKRESWQGAAFPFEIVKDATQPNGVRLEGKPQLNRYLTQRSADEYRAFNHPQVKWLKGDLFAVLNNYDPNNNTNTDQYTMVVRADGSTVNVTGNVVRSNGDGLGQSVRTFNKNNDNSCGYQFTDALEREVLPDGRIRIVFHCLSNGNGRDDSWWAETLIDCNDAGTSCDIRKGNDQAICLQEERSRGTCESVNGIDVCFCTNGNSQPMREGVWAGAVDPATGNLLWKQRLAYKDQDAQGRTTYAMRIKAQSFTNPDGTDTGKIVGVWDLKRGANQNGVKGGRTEKVMMFEMQPTADGPNMIRTEDITSLITKTGTDHTHSAMFFSYAGKAGAERPVIQLLHGNYISGYNGAAADIVNIAIDGAKPELLAPTKLSIPGDTHLYANKCGANPNNQGRGFMDMRTVRNPWVNEAGATQGIPFYQLTVLAGKTTDDPKLKLDLNAEIWAPVTPNKVVEPPPAPETAQDTPTTTTPGQQPSNNDPSGTAPPPAGELAGCSVTGNGANSGLALLIGLGLVFGLRRRRR